MCGAHPDGGEGVHRRSEQDPAGGGGGEAPQGAGGRSSREQGNRWSRSCPVAGGDDAQNVFVLRHDPKRMLENRRVMRSRAGTGI
jgi:hypothetical protein